MHMSVLLMLFLPVYLSLDIYQLMPSERADSAGSVTLIHVFTPSGSPEEGAFMDLLAILASQSSFSSPCGYSQS